MQPDDGIRINMTIITTCIGELLGLYKFHNLAVLNTIGFGQISTILEPLLYKY